MPACYGHTGWLTVITVCNRRAHVQSSLEPGSVAEFMCAVIYTACEGIAWLKLGLECIFFFKLWVDLSARQNGDIVSFMPKERWKKKQTYGFVYDYWYTKTNIYNWIIKTDSWCLANISLLKTGEVLHQQIEPQRSWKAIAETAASNP